MEVDYGCDAPTKQEILLQFSSDEDQKSFRWGHYRCGNRSWFRFGEDRTGEDSGVDTPEKRTRNLEEKALGLDATNWLKEKLNQTIKGEDELVVRTELVGGVGKYGRLLGWLYVGDSDISLNEQMIEEGYAWPYDGGTKQKNFEDLREIRRQHGTLDNG